VTIKELKEKLIEEFKKETRLKRYTPIEVLYKDKWLRGRVDFFTVNEERDEVEAHIRYSDEVSGTYLFRPRCITKQMLREDKVRILDEKKIKFCIHYWEFENYTGKYKKVFTLGGIIEKEICIYKCKYCGKTKAEA